MSAEPGDLPPDQDSEGCLCVVASYSDLAPGVGPVVAEAAKRIMMSPALGDFIELRFTDVGPRPEDAEGHGHAALAVLTEEFLHPASGVGRNFFALVVADTSAAAAERLLDGCAAVPVVAGLPIRLRGIATSDDRDPVAGTGPAADIVVSPTGSWSPDALVAELRSYAEDLLQYFATGSDPGVSPNELRMFRSRLAESAAQPSGSAVEAGPFSEPEQETVTTAEAVPIPDLLAPVAAAQPRDAPLAGDDDAAHVTPEPAPVPEPPPATAGEPAPVLEAAPPRQQPSHRRFWRPVVRRRGPEPEVEPGVSEKTAALAYMIVASDISGDHAAWQNGRSMLLGIDQKIAASPLFSYEVRALHIGPDGVRGALRPAGSLSRRDIRQPAGDTDFAAVLSGIRTMLKVDRAAIRVPDTPTAWPAVIFFATDPPLADTATAEAYQELARETSIIWVVPRDSADLMAPGFTEAPDTLMLVYHQEAAEEVANLLTNGPRHARGQ